MYIYVAPPSMDYYGTFMFFAVYFNLPSLSLHSHIIRVAFINARILPFVDFTSKHLALNPIHALRLAL